MGRLFVAVPVTVAALATAVVVTPAVGDWMGERESRRNVRAYERRVAPALAALRGMRVEGLDGTCRVHEHGVCLRGELDLREATSRTEKALRAAGATDVRSRCKESATGKTTLCGVKATLAGADVSVAVMPVFVARRETRTVEVFAAVTSRI